MELFFPPNRIKGSVKEKRKKESPVTSWLSSCNCCNMIQIMPWCCGLWSKSLAQTQRGDGGILLIDGGARGISRDQYAPDSCPRCVVQRTHMPQSVFTLHGRKLHVWMSVYTHKQSLNTRPGRCWRMNYSPMHFCATRGLCCEWP